MKKVKFGRKTVNVYYDNFEYFQPNSHSCGDCALRAVAKATNQTWYTVFDDLIPIARKMQRMPNDTEVIGKYLEEKGFKWVPIKVEYGDSRPLVHEFAKNHEETCVLRVSHHLTSSGKGKYYDIWDCGDNSLYGYWIKK